MPVSKKLPGWPVVEHGQPDTNAADSVVTALAAVRRLFLTMPAAVLACMMQNGGSRDAKQDNALRGCNVADVTATAPSAKVCTAPASPCQAASKSSRALSSELGSACLSGPTAEICVDDIHLLKFFQRRRTPTMTVGLGRVFERKIPAAFIADKTIRFTGPDHPREQNPGAINLITARNHEVGTQRAHRNTDRRNAILIISGAS